jgi:signal transduction histidine kinase
LQDLAALHQILENLLSNAVRFSPPGSPISLSLSKETGSWIIDVADEGPGIPEDERSQLFHKFYRSSTNTPSQQGAGLGLFIVSQMAKHLGGSIAYRDRSPRGAVFSLRLPKQGPEVGSVTTRLPVPK